MMNIISTRIATIDDLDVTASLFDAYRQFYDQEPDISLARKFISDRVKNNESIILLATIDNQKVIGFCQLYPTFCSVEAKPIYSLYDLYVIPEARRTGAGKVLLQKAESLAADRGMVRLDLTTAKTNVSAQFLYESQSWIKDEVFYAYSKRVDRSGT